MSVSKSLVLNIDLHCHSRFSADGVSEPEDIISVARSKGLHGVAITDHNTCECLKYYADKGLMREDGLPVDGFLIIPGQEITTADGHLLALGIQLPDLKGIPASKAVKLIHEAGGVAVAPHPYDLFRAGIREATLEKLDLDGIEVFNAATTLRMFNRSAQKYARSRGLPMTAGSDAHHSEAVGTAYTILEAESFSVKGILKALRYSPKRKERYLTASESLKKTLGTVIGCGRKKYRSGGA